VFKPVIPTSKCNMSQIFETLIVSKHTSRAEMCFVRITEKNKMTETQIYSETDLLQNNAVKTVHMMWKNNQLLLNSKTPINS